MGYYTRYTLTTKPVEKQEEAVQLLENLIGYDPTSQSTKWYDREEDLCKLSSSPELVDVLLILDGEGEETGDEWRCFAKNGRKEMIRREQWNPPIKPSFE